MHSRPRCLRLFACLAALAAIPSGALEVSVDPTWNGWARIGTPIQLSVEVISKSAGTLTIRLADESSEHVITARVEPDTRYVFRPVMVPNNPTLKLSARLDAGEPVEQEIHLRPKHDAKPIVAIASKSPTDLPLQSLSLVHVASDSLPYHPAGYAVIDLLVIDFDLLVRLDRDQVLALQQHAEGCGRMLFHGITPEALAPYRQRAGCGGKFLMAERTRGSLPERARELLAKQPSAEPTARRLRTLLNGNPLERETNYLALFFLIYLSAMLASTASAKPLRFVCVACAAGLLVGIVTWTFRPHAVEQVTWTEITSGDDVGRRTVLVRVTGGGAGDVTLPLGDSSAILTPIERLPTVTRAEQDRFSLGFSTSLFNRSHFSSTGTVRPGPTLNLRMDGGTPTVTNPETVTSSTALLSWRGTRYDVPKLEPLATWTPPSEPDEWKGGRAESLFRQMTARDIALLVFPATGDARTSTDLLVIRP